MRIFYGWRMVAAGCGLQFLQASLILQSFGAYVAVLSEQGLFTKTELSGAVALQQIEAALLGPLLGWVIDRFGAQGVIRAGVVCLSVGLVLLSLAHSLAAFYGAFLVIGAGLVLGGFFPINVALIHWFERKRARALSALSLGLAAGGSAVPLVAWCIARFGWRPTAIGSGIAALALGLPLAAVFRRRPSDVGETIDGLPRGSSHREPLAGAAASAEGRDFTAREALRTPAFWLISLGHGFALLVVYAVSVHAIAHLTEDLGYTVPQASFAITLVTLSQAAGVLVGWAIGDRFDKRFIAAACMLMHMGGLLLLTYATAGWMVVAFAILHGVAWGLRGPFMQAIRADYFGRAAIGMILGLSTSIIVIGQVGGPMISGVLADATGSYRPGFTVIALLAGLGSLFFLFARPPVRPR